MKRSLLLAIVLVMSASVMFGQAFEKGNHGINVGIGIGNTGSFGAGYKGFVPSISGSYEYGIVEVPMGAELTGVVSVGGFAGWSTYKYAWTYWDDVTYRYSTITFGARGNYHFIFMDKLDTYAGVWIGYRIVSGKWTGNGQIPPDWAARSSAVTGGAYVGARYFFNPKFGVYAELGYLISILNFGVTFKIEGNK